MDGQRWDFSSLSSSLLLLLLLIQNGWTDRQADWYSPSVEREREGEGGSCLAAGSRGRAVAGNSAVFTMEHTQHTD